MIQFIKTIASAYSQRFKTPGLPDAPEYCFVFPNKRAGSFFLKELRDANPEGLISPQITTISDFVADLSGRVIVSRINLLFILYRCYCKIMDPMEKKNPEDVVKFDAFRKWGETVLRDFNEVDMHVVTPKEIFKNVKDFKSISADYLTDEQKEVLREYFGYSVPEKKSDSDSLWLNYDEASTGKDGNNIRAKFVHLWRILYPLYEEYQSQLKSRGFASSGTAYRLALENVMIAADADDYGESLHQLLPWKKIVMVGFNALSGSEQLLFKELYQLNMPGGSDEKLCDFIWDSTGPILSDEDNSAGRFVAINRKRYPSPEWIKTALRMSDKDTLPTKMEIIAAPSKVMQVKIASGIISEMNKDDDVAEEVSKANVALVVPDETLLLPLLYSLPKNVDKVNLTMGYPLKLTSVNSFLALLRKLQLARRDAKTYYGFAIEQFCDILSHPYSQYIFSTPEILKFRKELERRHARVVKESDIKKLGEKASVIFAPLPENASSHEVIEYLDDVLKIIGEALYTPSSCTDENILKDQIEKHHIEAWRDALKIFDDSIREYGVQLSKAATLAEAYRLLQGETVPFEGEPLEGLQIMGMLETRALDFKHLVIVGMNDRTIPGRMRQRSFIPNIIRREFGMPLNSFQEDLFGYYFFRLISRAETATFIFDSRVTGGNGGESRYLLQLRYLYARHKVNYRRFTFGLASRESFIRTVEKSDFVMRQLQRYLYEEKQSENGIRNADYSPGDNKPTRSKNFSASLMKTYTGCPLRFYYQAVMDIKDDPAPTPSVNAITLGNVVHAVMEELYLPNPSDREMWLAKPVEITRGTISSFLSKEGKAAIADKIRYHLNKEHYHLPPELRDTPLPVDTEIIADNIRDYVIDILEYDREMTPFNIYGTEIRESLEYELPDGRKVNMVYALDRVDDIECEEAGELRIVDYKTGGSHITAKSLGKLFESDYKKDNLLQLMIYCLLANEKRAQNGETSLTFRPRIYPVGHLMQSKETGKLNEKMVPTIEGKNVETCSEYEPAFKELLDNALIDIFSREEPFQGMVTEKRCKYCPFIDACTS